MKNSVLCRLYDSWTTVYSVIYPLGQNVTLYSLIVHQGVCKTFTASAEIYRPVKYILIKDWAEKYILLTSFI